MSDRQDRLHAMCRQLTVEDDPQQLIKQMTEINNILGTILSEVDEAMRSVDARTEHLMHDSAVTALDIVGSCESRSPLGTSRSHKAM